MDETSCSSVLLVESDEGLARSLQILIEDEVLCTVRVVHSVSEAVAELQKTGSTDVVVSDAATALASLPSLQSPQDRRGGASNPTLLELIQERLPDAMVILMTAHRALLTSAEQAGLGNSRVLLKPIDPGDLLASVRAATDHPPSLAGPGPLRF